MTLHDVTCFLHKHITKLFLITLGFWIFLTMIFFYIYSKNPLNAIEDIQSFKSANANLLTSNGSISFWNLLFHNIEAVTLYLLFGFIAPLSILMIVILSKSVGTALVYSQVQNAVPLWKNILLGILPHGIFELSAVFMCISLGLYIGTYWLRNNKSYTWKALIKYTLFSYIYFVLPLVILAALVETYITPQLRLL